MTDTQIFKIASIPADGVGKEVVAAGRRVLDVLAGAVRRQVRLRLDGIPLGLRATTQAPEA